ncbi:diacylglycerol/lipid kinase family protein [Geodermatophilus marinus]|uniref:diacylglycerol/lipid kinase family protein n=1 Tax=Geodermatophilus sp. LHW52908 TaxID=2303986 RepID=UPI000E3EAC86|nr:diacylglycerol kinase family protein [Geodermatophilus sp. LHW52908]RFU21874.1 diacylglycerol kinase family lipid kinase [Geodermatophilus sp. LHW52908]
MRALVVANPAATTTTRAVRDRVLALLRGDLKVDLAETRARGHGAALARQAVVDGVDVLVVLGGDGTVNEAVNGLLHAGPAPGLPLLAVVPGGSTNVFARALGRARDPVTATEEVLASLRAGRTRLVSLGTASARGASAVPATGPAPEVAQAAADTAAAARPEWGEPRWFVFSAGLGFDADVIARVEARRARGRRSTGALYVREATRAFVLGAERRRPAMTLEVAGAAPVDGLFLCLVSNVAPWTYLGARAVNPTPQASFDTGLDVFAMGRVGVLRMLHHVRQVLAVRPDARGRGVHRFHDVAEVTLTAVRPQGWQVDGDHLGTATGLRLTGVPAALRVVG